MNLLAMGTLKGLGVLVFFGAVLDAQAAYQVATFAGGCFWCMQPPFEEVKGVVKVVAGYTGGSGKNPLYEDYARKGHLEAVQITYDPSQITYSRLLDIFWRQIDPTDSGGQFVDRGPQYRSAIFYHNEEQRLLAEKSREERGRSGRSSKAIRTEILKAAVFYPAEEYHQDYYKKNPLQYCAYRSHAGRDKYLKRIWGQAGH
jgi:peptide methionine sulfoxide reductase msrA/msrB